MRGLRLLVDIQSLHQCGERKTNLLFQSWELAIIMTVSSHRQKLMDPYRVCRREQRELGKNPVWHWQDGKQWLFSFHGVYMFNAMRLTLNCVLLKRTLATQWLSRFLEALIITVMTQVMTVIPDLPQLVWLSLKGGLESRNTPNINFRIIPRFEIRHAERCCRYTKQGKMIWRIFYRESLILRSLAV